jgi:broad specificity phosphatase PhoE
MHCTFPHLSVFSQHTGTSDIPLTTNGEQKMRELGQQIVGDGSEPECAWRRL